MCRLSTIFIQNFSVFSSSFPLLVSRLWLVTLSSRYKPTSKSQMKSQSLKQSATIDKKKTNTHLRVLYVQLAEYFVTVLVSEPFERYYRACNYCRTQRNTNGVQDEYRRVKVFSFFFFSHVSVFFHAQFPLVAASNSEFSFQEKQRVYVCICSQNFLSLFFLFRLKNMTFFGLEKG